MKQSASVVSAAVALLCASVAGFVAPLARADDLQLRAVFTLNGTPTVGSGLRTYGADVDRLDGSPTVMFDGDLAFGNGTPFIDFEGNSYPAGQAAGFNTPGDAAPRLRVQFTTSEHGGGYQLSFDYNSTSTTRAGLAYRYADDPAFGTLGSVELVPDGQWHHVVTSAPFAAGRSAEFGIAANSTSTAGTLLFDNFQLLSGTVPEPGTTSLLVLPALATLRRRRR